MSALSKKLRSIEGGRIGFWCPGREEMHVIRVAAPDHPSWTFDGNVDAPTFAPSIKVTYRHPKGYTNENPAPAGYDGPYVEEVCHSFVRSGQIEFLGDCTHALAGKTVALPDLPQEWTS
jgi:hypothetical protein